MGISTFMPQGEKKAVYARHARLVGLHRVGDNQNLSRIAALRKGGFTHQAAASR